VKYVALLAFNRIVSTHPYLVAQQEDVIMDCIDSADMSIRLRALDLVVGMVSSDNLVSIVGRLMRQLRNAPSLSPVDDEANDRGGHGIEPMADSDEESPEVQIKPDKGADQAAPLPDDYKIDVIGRILDMCSANNYDHLVDFEWYIDILVQLIRNAPVPRTTESRLGDDGAVDVSERIGDELRNVAVKVKAIRATATRAAEEVVVASSSQALGQMPSGKGALRPIVWMMGEYANLLGSPNDALTAILQISKPSVNVESLAIYLQALTKVFSIIAGDDTVTWTSERKTMMSLLMARIVHTLEPMASHPDLEIQERAVEFLELLKLAAEASSGQEASTETEDQDAPLLLTQAIPSLFSGQELNSVAVGAQRNVPLPTGLDLDQPININLPNLLQSADFTTFDDSDHDEFEAFYHQQPLTSKSIEPAINRLASTEDDLSTSYQKGSDDSYLDPDIIARRRAERREKNKDDPFYIASMDSSSGTSTPLHNILKSNNGQDLDIDAIPIMQLDLDKNGSQAAGQERVKKPRKTKPRQHIQVAADENLTSGTSTPGADSEGSQAPRARALKGKSGLLQVDSSNIGAFSLEGGTEADPAWDYERQQQEEADMAKAMKEVEKLRLEMQRANERIQTAQGVPPEGTVVKKKTKKSKAAEGDAVAVKPKKKKKAVTEGETAEVVKPKKKKKKAKVEEVEGNRDDGNGDDTTHSAGATGSI
jgi:AP-3 complex subunit delta-1